MSGEGLCGRFLRCPSSTPIGDEATGGRVHYLHYRRWRIELTPTADDRAGENRSIPAIETTLLRVVAVFRVVATCWLILLAILVLATETPAGDPTQRMLIVASTIVIAVGWTLVTVIFAYRRPGILGRPGFLVVDLVLAVWVGLAPNLIETDIFFAGGYPISSPILIATTTGVLATLAPAAMVAGASAFGVGFAGARAAEVLAINLLSPLVVAWGFGTITAQDEKRRQAEEALAVERTKLARADERAEMAAHLHDSVLQTLALIQRRSPDNRDVTRLARRQERQLRAWLNGPALAAGNTLSSALIRAAEEVEDEYDVIVEMSTAGDRELDDRCAGLVLAAREAMTNAARFAEVDRVYVLCETSSDQIRLVVRDQGVGFDPDTVSEDRRGVRESIVGRLDRLGGTAFIRSSVGDGTEVELSLEEVGT
jgi:signal transduction histidine kinase